MAKDSPMAEYYGMSKDERLNQVVPAMRLPETYKANNTKEHLCLEFVENFRVQFVQLYPTRAPLMLSPENESGVKKFICTYLKPTELPFEELYDYNTCSKYVADYINYEELESPTELPLNVVSPTTTLAWQSGDCFDITLLLLSLLLGTGYDAYGVVGYASRAVTTNDTSRHSCPWALPKEVDAEEKDQNKGKRKSTKYQLRKRPELESKFEQQKEDKRRLEAEGGMKADELDAVEEEREYDDLQGQRIHCWILVQPGKRDISTAFFIEPCTGDTIPLDCAEYVGIESIFNNNNYWVNMQEAIPLVKDLSFNLKDLTKWEYIFMSDTEVDDEDREEKSERNREDLTAEAGEAGDQILDLPASWVSPLALSREQYEHRYPGLRKTIVYKNSILELFSEYSQADMKVRKLVVLDVDNDNSAIEEHTFFQHRTDKLRRRSIVMPTGDTRKVTHDWFDEGRRRDQTYLEALREHIVEEGKRSEMRFYSEARLDGLARRLEIYTGETGFPTKVMEFYEGREDRLIYRSASYETAPGVSIITPGQKVTEDSKPLPKKMTEKFDRNPNINAGEDVAKRTYYKPTMTDGSIKVLFHYADGKITRPSRKYSRAQGQGVVVENVDAFAKQPKPAVLADEMRILFQKEKECLACIRESEKDAKEILAQRAKEESNVESTISVYDTLRNRRNEDENAEARRKAEELNRANKKKDYLAPYIEQFIRQNQKPGTREPTLNELKLSKEDSQKIKESCLKELKERLIQRAHIMHERLNIEKEAVARRQANYVKNQEVIDPREHEEYTQYCLEATWRIHILEKRLERHHDQSLDRYNELENRLNADPRLSALKT